MEKTTYDWEFRVALTALIFGAVAMGASPIFVRLVSSEVGPFASAFWRLFFALPILYAWMKIDARRKPSNLKVKKKKGFHKLSILAGLAFAFDLFFWHLSILNTSVANATFFATLTPVYVMVISFFFFKQKIAKASLVGVFLCLLGGATLVGQTMQVSPESLKGDIFGFITAFFFSLYFLALGLARKDGERAAKVSFEQAFIACLVLFVIALSHSFFSKVGFFPVTKVGLLALLGMAVISQVAGQGLLAVSLGRLPTIFSSLVIFLEALAAAFMAWIFLAESVYLIQVLGGFFILLGIWVARPKSQK